MMNFGYTINKSTRIDLDRNQRDIAAHVLKHEPSFAYCIGCGSCTATCSAGLFTSLNLRKIQLLVHRGETQKLRQETEKCMLCGKCQMVCPRGINTRNLLITIHEAIIKYATDETSSSAGSLIS